MNDGEDTAGLIGGPSLPAHLYVHVPFCRSKCDYCDFHSVVPSAAEDVEAVFAGIERELRRWAHAALPGALETVYVGGGTPSAWPAPVASVLRLVRDLFPVRANAEVTVEANPDSLDATAARVLSGAGATRISVGVQSMDDGELRGLGRRHDAGAASRACRHVMEAGMRLSVDLICGIPGQTMESWGDTVERAAKTGARHVSVYPLSIEDGTPMWAARQAGLLEETDEDLVAEMMLLAREHLGHLGLSRYEVANYAESAGDRSRHNLAYWTGRPYIGAGPAAHGMLDAPTGRVMGLIGPGEDWTARVRYANPSDLDAWVHGPEEAAIEVLDAGRAAREDVMMGLRLVAGVPDAQARAVGLAGVMASLVDDGLVESAGERWRTTERGWLLGNEVFGRVWAGEPPLM
jgi:putative oxygen-independent coproporphyrinogen III oxidase